MSLITDTVPVRGIRVLFNSVDWWILRNDRFLFIFLAL